MRQSVLNTEALGRIEGIHQLSTRYNQQVEKPHQQQLLELIRKHIDEIEELFKKNDPHAIIETGDLLILGFEILLENRASIDAVLLRCFQRYETKLSILLKNEKM
ncbi:MAG TPA: hypothetical protein DD723_07065 [Candidatus Omnitrophica bacterium]|nr:MAG: hypothetical protein A2Z81_05895 [Omnitrophica WOR_2 bacterium GWA2_45_18]OGX19860.1 MAG: hypothetical protein A2Y04_05355 [Omnitrophica WOR_2 bacterium GWC2_45_7]HBR15285.1 hypothetical protein [Candidatus Omnitrophota bacterium]